MTQFVSDLSPHDGKAMDRDAISKRVRAIRHPAFIGALMVGSLIPFYFLFDQEFVNRWLPPILGAGCLWILFQMRRVGLAQVILTPIAWFLAVCAVYYGVGPLIYIYGNAMSLARLHSFYAVDQQALWRTNLLNVVSIALILFFFSVGMRVTWLRPFKAYGHDRVLSKTAYIFACIGILFTVLTVGLRLYKGDAFLMPGIFFTLARCTHTSLFLSTLLYFRGRRDIRILFLGMTVLVGFFAFTSLMKQNIIEFAMMLFFGIFLAAPSARKLVIAACAVVAVFPALHTITTYARIMIWTQGANRASTADLVRAFSDVEGIDAITQANVGNQGSWQRISSAPVQAFAMDSFDRGQPGSTFGTALWAFVPRLIYPDKPIITQGDVFTTLVKGRAVGGGTGAGYFGEAYWNKGWPGVLLMSVFVGMLLAVFTQFNSNMVLTGNYQYFAVAFMTLASGYRADDWLVAVTFNSIPLMIVLYILTDFITRRVA